MTAQGHNIPRIRMEYQQMITQFEQQLQLKMNSGLSAQEISRWAVNERTHIVRRMRTKQGLSSKLILELRDYAKYGPDSRSYDSLAQRALNKGIDETDIPRYLMDRATAPNKGVSKAAIEGAKFLKHGGRVVVVVSIPITAYTLLTASEGELEQIIYEQIGGAAGGFVGGGIGAGLCIAFGVATSGWGLLACGVVGGGAGGFLGSVAAEKIYVMKGGIQNPTAVVRDGAFQQIDPNALLSDIHATGCYPNLNYP